MKTELGKIDISKSTPRPWIVKRVLTSCGQCFKIGSPEQVGGEYGAICVYDDSTSLNPRKRGNAEADANLIARAINEYDALNAVANAAIEWIVDKHGNLNNAMEWLNHNGDIACGGQGVLIRKIHELIAIRDHNRTSN